MYSIRLSVRDARNYFVPRLLIEMHRMYVGHLRWIPPEWLTLRVIVAPCSFWATCTLYTYYTYIRVSSVVNVHIYDGITGGILVAVILT